MSLSGLAAILTAFFTLIPAPAQPQTVEHTRVVILGVDHSRQLMSRQNEAGMMTTFIDKLRPAAICIERPPELAERRDFYEFTYEVQGIVLPYVAAHPIELCPVDWIPPVEDQKLVFGSDLDEPPEIRPKSGSQSFLTFPDRRVLSSDIFAADDPSTTKPVVDFAGTPRRADQDFPRRLFLYRTFMQSRHILDAAKAHLGQTLLVVIGFFHKTDLENILSGEPAIEVVKPSAIGRPSQDEADRAMTRPQQVAVLSFNLLGAQSRTGIVDWEWMGSLVSALQASSPRAENELFRIRLDELTGRASRDATIARLRKLIQDTPQAETFSWTGVKDVARIDSYFDPFGNLTVRQRAILELARLLRSNGVVDEPNRLIDEVKAQIGPRQARQLDVYAAEYLMIPGK
jgi:hypothetical protein